jgi:hypothetical protein
LLDFCEHSVSVGFKIFIGKVPHLFSHVCQQPIGLMNQVFARSFIRLNNELSSKNIPWVNFS